MNRPRRIIGATSAVTLITMTVTALSLSFAQSDGKTEPPATRPAAATDFSTVVTPLLQTHCVSCHSAEKKKGSLDLQRFTSVEQVRKELKVWQQVIEQIEAGEMPPKDKPPPTADEKAKLLAWIRGFLDAEARTNAGDPGYVPLRRLSNTEYDNTIRDLTGVDLRPAKEFPVDGAGAKGSPMPPKR